MTKDVTDVDPTTGMYAAYRVSAKTAAQILNLARAQGFSHIMRPTKMHVTTVYSRRFVPTYVPSNKAIGATFDHFKIFPEKDAPGFGTLVAVVHSPALVDRWAEGLRCGATYDFPDYVPHISLGRVPTTFKVKDLPPFDFPLVFDYEYSQMRGSWGASSGYQLGNELMILSQHDGSLYYLQPDGRYKKGGDGRSQGLTKDELPANAVIAGLTLPGRLTHDLPKTFLHYTATAEAQHAIVAHGFDLNSAGASGARLGAGSITKNDPVGVWATDLEWAGKPENFRPWVTFRLKGRPQALVSRHYLFSDLAQATGRTGADLTAFLLKNGIQVVQSVNEFVVLDPALIEIVDQRKTAQTALSVLSALFTKIQAEDEAATVAERRKMRGAPIKAPSSVVVIYRACAASVLQFKPMDYVTASRKFAVEHADHQAAVEGESYHVIKATVKSAEVYNALNPGEYFYDGPATRGTPIYVAEAD